VAAAVPKPVAPDPEPEPMEEEAARVEDQEDPASAPTPAYSDVAAERPFSIEKEGVATAEATTGATGPAEAAASDAAVAPGALAATAAANEPGAPAATATVQKGPQKTRKDKGKGKGKGKKVAEEDDDGLLNRAEIAASLAEQKRRMQSLKANRPEGAAGAGARDSVSAAEAKVAEEIRLLMGGAQEAEENNDVMAADEGADPQAPPCWAPPSGQTGDGRTSLNDMLGY
jgi:hypothetical protein